MKKTILFALLASSSAALAFAGCSSTNSSTAGDGGTDSSMTEDSTTGDTGTSDTGTPTDSGVPGDAAEAATPPPNPPTLGAQIDRMGRPAINTTLNHTFDPTCVNTSSSGPCAPKDAYNADNNPANWSVPPATDGGTVPGYFAQFFGNLAIYDSLDGVCGNQAGYNYGSTDGGVSSSAPAYSAMAGVLSQDALWLNTNASTCQGYLSVELAALSAQSNTDCGGRAPLYNTIDVTYNLLAGTFIPPGSDAGNYPGPVTNGITAPNKAPSTTFPYFATPH
jgi:hypothetical protein